ncbi:hypothetical protein SprV_0200784100 [Sparganum proliferum]
MAIDDKLFKVMFIQRLPTSVQKILASGSDDLDFSKLAEMADRMMEVERLSPTTVSQISQPLTAFTSDLAEVKTQIAQLSATVATLQLCRSAGPSRRSFGPASVVVPALALGPSSHVYLDIVGPLPLYNGCSYPFTCVDRFTRWPEAIPLPAIAARTMAKAFLSRWVAIFGAPSTITTDRGAQFESNHFQTLLSFLGCARIWTTTYHPAANPDFDCTTAELVFGATVQLRGEMVSPTPQGAIEDPTNLLHRLRWFMRPLSPSYLEKDLATCSHVYLRFDRVRRPLDPPCDGPFGVLSRWTETFLIQRENRAEVLSVDRLKASVLAFPSDEFCSTLPSVSSPPPALNPPSRIFPLSPCPLPPTATSNSDTAATGRKLQPYVLSSSLTTCLLVLNLWMK